MGTKTFGNTSAQAGDTYYSTANGTSWASGSTGTAPEEMYIDNIYIYCGSHDGGASSFTFGVFDGSLNLLSSTGSYSYGTGYGWNHGSLGAGSYCHIASGALFKAGFFATGQGSQIQCDTNTTNGSFYIQLNTSSLGSMGGAMHDTGSGNLQWYVTYFPHATISGLSSSSGTVGQNIAVYGQSFSAGIASVTLSGVGCSYSVQSDSQLTFTVPAGANSGTLTVTTYAGQASYSTFYVVPTFSSLSASSGHTGDTVSIYGTGFVQVNGVYFNGVAANYSVISDTQINATVPAAATTGPIHIATAGGNAYSGTFSILPTISGFSPTSGGVGTAVTINGSGFADATGVQFNGTAAGSVTVNSDTQITASVPSGATTGPITVTGNGGSVASGTNFTVASAYVYRNVSGTNEWVDASEVAVYRNVSGTDEMVIATGTYVYRDVNGTPQWVIAS